MRMPRVMFNSNSNLEVIMTSSKYQKIIGVKSFPGKFEETS